MRRPDLASVSGPFQPLTTGTPSHHQLATYRTSYPPGPCPRHVRMPAARRLAALTAHVAPAAGSIAPSGRGEERQQYTTEAEMSDKQAVFYRQMAAGKPPLEDGHLGGPFDGWGLNPSIGRAPQSLIPPAPTPSAPSAVRRDE